MRGSNKSFKMTRMVFFFHFNLAQGKPSGGELQSGSDAKGDDKDSPCMFLLLFGWLRRIFPAAESFYVEAIQKLMTRSLHVCGRLLSSGDYFWQRASRWKG